MGFVQSMRSLPRSGPATRSACGTRHRPRCLPVRPHGQLVPARVAEVEPTAARERVGLADDLPTRLHELRFDLFQTGGVDHHERIAGPGGPGLAEAAAQTSALGAAVVRSAILEPPTRN